MNVLLSQIKATMLKLYTISSRTFIMVTVLFRLTNAILKIRKSFLPVTLSVKPVSLCTRTAYSLIETEPVKSTAALTRGLKTASVPATINAGTMERRIAAARSMLLYPMITDFLLTVTAYHSRRYMLCVPKLNVTIPDSS